MSNRIPRVQIRIADVQPITPQWSHLIITIWCSNRGWGVEVVCHNCLGRACEMIVSMSGGHNRKGALWRNGLRLCLHLFPTSVHPAITIQGKSYCIWFSPHPTVNAALAPGLPEFIREHLNHTELSCTKAVGREGQINWRRAGACWIVMRHVNRRLASHLLCRGLNKVGRADYWEFWRRANWEASRHWFAWVRGNGISTSCPAIRGLPRSLCRRTVTVSQIYPLFQFH